MSNPQQNKLGEMERQLRHFSRLLLGEQNRSAQLCDSSMRALNRSLIRQIEKQIEGSEELSAKARKLTAVSGVGIRTAAVLLAQTCLDRDMQKLLIVLAQTRSNLCLTPRQLLTADRRNDQLYFHETAPVLSKARCRPPEAGS